MNILKTNVGVNNTNLLLSELPNHVAMKSGIEVNSLINKLSPHKGITSVCIKVNNLQVTKATPT